MQDRLRQRFLLCLGQIHTLIPTPRKGARILLLSDAPGWDGWHIYMLIRLTYGDPSLEAYRMTVWRANHLQLDPKTFDYVLDWVDGRFVLVNNK